MKEIIFVEKRAIASTLIKIFNKDFIDTGSYFLSKDKIVLYGRGHLIQLEERDKKWDIPAIIRVLNRDYLKTVKNTEIERILSSLDLSEDYTLVLATDYDIEGEVISNDFKQLFSKLVKQPASIKRWKFSSLSLSELKKTYDNLQDLSNSYRLLVKGEFRRNSDFIEGICATKLINLRKIKNNDNLFLTTGRVKSAMLRILEQREREIERSKKFPIYNYTDILKLTFENKEILLKRNNSSGIPISEIKELTVEETIRTESYTPPLPYNTKRLSQKLASKGYTTAEIRTTLENFYYKGLISYPRTDSELYEDEYFEKVIIKYPEETFITREDFTKISLNGKIVDHPAISLIYDNTVEFQSSFQKTFYNCLENLIKETFFKATTITIPCLKLVINGRYTFKTDLVSIKDTIKDIPIETSLEKKRVYIDNYSLSELLKELTLKNIGTKSTQLWILEDLEVKGYYKNIKNKINIEKKLFSEYFERIKRIEDKTKINFLTVEECSKFQNNIDIIELSGESDKLLSELLEKWNRIITIFKT